MYKATNGKQNVLLTPSESTCFLCQIPTSGDQLLCDDCVDDLPQNQHACKSCALSLPAHTSEAYCASCLRDHYPITQSIIPFRYEFPINNLIKHLKYKEKIYFSGYFSDAILNEVSNHYHSLPDIVLSVPLHPLRFRQRGYNQGKLIAKPLSEALKIPFSENVCRRIINTQSQTGLDKKARIKNLRNAFVCDQKRLPKNTRHVVLVDDVVTSGITTMQLARALKAKGIERVDVWACARADLQNKLSSY